MTWTWEFSDGSSYTHNAAERPPHTGAVEFVRASVRSAVGGTIGAAPGLLRFDPADVRHVHAVVSDAVSGLCSIVSAPAGADAPIDWPRDEVESSPSVVH